MSLSKSLLLLVVTLLFASGEGRATSGVVTVNPQHCAVASAQGACATTLSWSALDAPAVCIWRVVPAPSLLTTCTLSGNHSMAWPYVVLGENKFELRAHSTPASNTEVSRQGALLLGVVSTYGVSGSLSSNPSQCELTGSTCAVNLSWTISGWPLSCVWRVVPAPVVLWSCAPTGIGVQFPYIFSGINTLELRSHASLPSSSDADRLRGTLLQATSVFGASGSPPPPPPPPVASCDAVVSAPGAIQSALDRRSNTVVCLASGVYEVNEQIMVPEGKTLRGQSTNANAVQLRAQWNGGVALWMNRGSTAKYLSLVPAPNVRPSYGVFVSGGNDVTAPVRIEQLVISGNYINLGIVDSSNVVVTDVKLRSPGDSSDGLSQPNVWIRNSSAVLLLRVTAENNSASAGVSPNGALSGDGEVGVYDSSGVTLDGLTSTNCETSAVYFRACTHCVIRNSTIRNAAGFGLDLVDAESDQTRANDGLLVEQTTVTGSGAAGAVLYLLSGTTATFRNNIFVDNRGGTYGRCSGIDVRRDSNPSRPPGRLITAGNVVTLSGLQQPELCESATP